MTNLKAAAGASALELHEPEYSERRVLFCLLMAQGLMAIYLSLVCKLWPAYLTFEQKYFKLALLLLHGTLSKMIAG